MMETDNPPAETITEYDAIESPLEIERPLTHFRIFVRARDNKAWKIYVCTFPIEQDSDEYGRKVITVNPCGARFLDLQGALDHERKHQEAVKV